ncbi:hypothetical protein [Flavivirga algicola]|uniref:Lipoprotein n=1 Tax=Flavivirga algicola TaxID=2729136 RepID=A0ABX1RSV5_9FLAO|nr:hypothetical protein [Flavivirga algicola]NMH86621.1 hypothetical protein [Flavivirga algicola]
MKNFYFFLFLFLILFSCSNSNTDKDTLDINGLFTYTTPNCNNGGNPEINCILFIKFLDESTVDVLIDGGDIVYRTDYVINDGEINFSKKPGLNYDISFKIINETTLKHIQNDNIWLKSE